jgi:tetratricopeptide (TPR) repeat protein
MSATDCNVLLDTCTTRVYSANGFPVLNAPVDASPRRLKRHSGDLQAALAMGTLEEEYSQFLRPQPLPTAEALAHAAHQLQDPVLRFVHEFFWFWPMEWGKSASDEGLLALKAGGPKQAQAVWVPAEKNASCEGSLVARHNLAVLGHLMALAGEAEILQASHQSNDIPQDAESLTDSHWQYTFKYWEALCPDEDFWSLLADRARAVGDPRLTTGFVKRFRETLPIGFDNINADIAVAMARQGHYKRARTHIRIMEQTNAGADDLEVNFRRIRRPLRDRIEHAVKQGTQEIQNHKKEGLTRAVSLYQSAKEPLNFLAVLLKKHDPSEYADAADQVAEAILDCMVAYGNDTKNLKKSKTVLQNTLQLAHGAKLKQRIQENIDTLEEMIKSGMFSLPEPALKMVEKANEAARRENWDGAVECLQSALKLTGRNVPEQLRKNLAACLASRGIRKANQAMEMIQASRRQLEQELNSLAIRGRPAEPTATVDPLYSVMAGHPLNRRFGCGRCGQNLQFSSGRASVSLPTGETVTLCSSCTLKLQQMQDRAEPSREAMGLLKSGANDLAEALRYDPTSEHARKNLADVNRLLSQLGQSTVTVPSPVVPSKGPASSAAGAPEDDPYWAAKLVIGMCVVAGVIVVIVLLSA